jgi:hypothetical protein
MRKIAALIAASLIGAGAWALPAGASSPWTGLGATLSNWARAHPKDTTGCPTGGCYGRRIKIGGRLTARFVEVRTTAAPAILVDGYLQAIGDGTSLGAATAAVRKLLPSDTRTTGFWIAHSHGDSCALWNLQSKTLARWFADTSADDPKGVLGIDLNTLTNAGSVYEPDDVSEAAVGTQAYAANATC